MTNRPQDQGPRGPRWRRSLGDDWTPEKAAEEAMAELADLEGRLDWLVERLAELQEALSEGKEDIESSRESVLEARDEFLDYYSALAAAEDPDIRAPMPAGPPPSPHGISVAFGSMVDQLVAELEDMFGSSYGRRMVCQNPKCGRTFLATRYTREKLYCSTSCRVQAFRARQKAAAKSKSAPPESEGGGAEKAGD